MDASFAVFGEDDIASYVRLCLEDAGYREADSLTEADLVFTYMANGSALEDRYFETDGLIGNARPGTCFIDLSPCDPLLVREIAAMATMNDCAFVEAPLAVRDPFAEDAMKSSNDAFCFVAGEPEAIQRARGVLEYLVDEIIVTGESGTAQRAKASYTTMQATSSFATIEAAMLFHGPSSSPEGPCDPSWIHALHDDRLAEVSALIEAEAFDQGYKVAHLFSDVAAAMASSEDKGMVLPQLETVLHALELISVIGGSQKGIMVLCLLYAGEEACARFGLDWSLAEDLFVSEAAEAGLSELDISDGFGDYFEN